MDRLSNDCIPTPLFPEPIDEIHPSLLKRKIIHFDMDAFYASVEIRANPDLKGKPIVVGGSPDSRGVVCTASYEARKFGIKSAMACSRAARLCPDAIFVSPDFAKYQAVTRQIHEIFRRYTSIIEPLSLDEAFLDVTDNDLGLYAVQIAIKIQQDIFNELHLTGSGGIAPNKLIAKIASDIKKPFGLTVVLPANVTTFMQNLPLRKINGVGEVTEKKLAGFGWKVCSDLWSVSREVLHERLGSFGPWLCGASRGIDERAVITEHKRKSLGAEITVNRDLASDHEILSALKEVSDELWKRMDKKNVRGKTVSIKIKYSDFTTITRSVTSKIPANTLDEIFTTAQVLWKERVERRDPVRLVGVSISGFDE